MPDLSVDVLGLGAIAGAMRAVAAGLDHTRAAISAAEHAMGSHDVVAALDHFEDHWDDGRGRIKDNLEGMEKALEDSMRAYQDTDRELTDALKKEQTTTTNYQGQA